jgi:transcriptional regulator with XRE-family HTH domain
MNIGKRLRSLRLTKGLSQGDIEQRTGLLRAFISKIENGHNLPTLLTLEKWAKALGVEMPELFIGDDEKPSSAAPMEGEQHQDSGEKDMVTVYLSLSPADRALLLSLAWEMVRLSRQEENRRS